MGRTSSKIWGINTSGYESENAALASVKLEAGAEVERVIAGKSQRATRIR